LDAIVSNWRQPMTMREGSFGSTAIEGSLAASPTMLSPLRSTFAWALKTPPTLAATGGEVTGG
jgi:hypothetical protein